MASTVFIDELRLDGFKSFRNAVLPLGDLTLLIGRNGSGKSNAIDALHVLARLAGGEDIREALEGNRREGQEVRGGVAGCAPFGSDHFTLGCRVVSGDEHLHLSVAIQTVPDVRIVGESLVRTRAGSPERVLLAADPADKSLSDINARFYNGKRGVNPAIPFRSDRLLVSQAPTRVPGNLKATREVQEAALEVVEALRAVFILDPVPTLMRQYVPERDNVLRRQADNLSAVIGALREDPDRWSQLKELARGLAEHEVRDIAVETSQLGDVMIALRERFEQEDRPFSARVMSDGMLRFLAFAAALLEPPLLDGVGEAQADTTLVIEEIENGLHPSQAARVIELIKAEAERRRIRTLATTHSPAILSVLTAEDHRSVIVCHRDPDLGRSSLTPLTELPGYADALAAGSLGEAVTRQLLDREPDVEERKRALDELLAAI
ncbi:MAG: AAA family ATPase [Solirubrobacterales bacterium]|nr:AAA family ATPase [Solirubrobacterales bacterium]